ncbi:MAG TPA: DUF3592 domain-containing protein [Bryobacteraceae bacterium]
MRKDQRQVFYVFVAIGVAIVAVALFLCLKTRHFVETARTADGLVIGNVWNRGSKGGGSYHARVRFQAGDGRELIFVSAYGTSPPAFPTGGHVEVLYDPEDPANARINTFAALWIFPVIFLGMGLLFVLCGSAPLAWQRHVDRRDEWLRSNGRRIQAAFDRVEVNPGRRSRRGSGWRIVCHWDDPVSKQTRVFRSHNLWQDPTRRIKGKTVEVFVDPDNLKRYVVSAPQAADDLSLH